MKTMIIISALEEEQNTLEEVLNLEDLKEISFGKFLFKEGLFKGNKVVLAISGVGRVNASLLVATIYNHYGNDVNIINIGTAGGLNQEIGSIVIGANSLYGDVDITAAGNYRFGQMSRCPLLFKADSLLLDKVSELDNPCKIVIGDICTNDSFTTSIDKVNALIKDYFSDLNIVAFDMESACYAQACLFYEIPFLSIRFISDNIGMESQSTTFEEMLEISSPKLSSLVLGILNSIF